VGGGCGEEEEEEEEEEDDEDDEDDDEEEEFANDDIDFVLIQMRSVRSQDIQRGRGTWMANDGGKMNLALEPRRHR